MKLHLLVRGALGVLVVATLFGGSEALAIASRPIPLSGYDFRVNGTLEETGSMDETSSPYFWLNSGGMMHIKNGVGTTVQGGLPIGSKWQKLYASSNPVDTDGGIHPQNLFRLVTRSKVQNLEQQAYFKIMNDAVSKSPNRDAHNGILLMSRYRQDGQTLYYTGLRVDGTVIVKAKKNTSYYTMYQSKIFPGVYNRLTNPNLLPHNEWLGIKSTVMNNANGTVTVTVFMDQGRTGVWKQIARVTDDGVRFGTPIVNSDFAGIRTDFMDVIFDDYTLKNL